MVTPQKEESSKIIFSSSSKNGELLSTEADDFSKTLKSFNTDKKVPKGHSNKTSGKGKRHSEQEIIYTEKKGMGGNQNLIKNFENLITQNLKSKGSTSRGSEVFIKSEKKHKSKERNENNAQKKHKSKEKKDVHSKHEENDIEKHIRRTFNCDDIVKLESDYQTHQKRKLGRDSSYKNMINPTNSNISTNTNTNTNTNANAHNTQKKTPEMQKRPKNATSKTKEIEIKGSENKNMILIESEITKNKSIIVSKESIERLIYKTESKGTNWAKKHSNPSSIHNYSNSSEDHNTNNDLSKQHKHQHTAHNHNHKHKHKEKEKKKEKHKHKHNKTEKELNGINDSAPLLEYSEHLSHNKPNQSYHSPHFLNLHSDAPIPNRKPNTDTNSKAKANAKTQANTKREDNRNRNTNVVSNKEINRKRGNGKKEIIEENKFNPYVCSFPQYRQSENLNQFYGVDQESAYSGAKHITEGDLGSFCDEDAVPSAIKFIHLSPKPNNSPSNKTMRSFVSQSVKSLPRVNSLTKLQNSSPLAKNLTPQNIPTVYSEPKIKKQTKIPSLSSFMSYVSSKVSSKKYIFMCLIA